MDISKTRAQHDQVVRANLGRFRGREIKKMGISGLSVAIGARVGKKAGPSQVLVSQTVENSWRAAASRSKTPASTNSRATDGDSTGW